MQISDERARSLAFLLQDADEYAQMLQELWADTTIYSKIAERTRLESLIVCRIRIEQQIKYKPDGTPILKEATDE